MWGAKMVTIAVSAPLQHFLEHVRVGCGGKGRVLVELGEWFIVGCAGGADLKCGEIYGLSKEKRKMLMLAAEHAESAPH